jgi:ribosomal protein S18 acetylase RimI-like enzyme
MKKKKLSIWEIEKRAFKLEDRSTKNFLLNLSRSKKTILVKENYGYAIGRELEFDREIKDMFQRKWNTFYLYGIAVIPEMQGKGMGEKLLKKLIVKVREKDFERITLHTDNLKMYNLAFKLGFRPKGRHIIDNSRKYYMVKRL